MDWLEALAQERRDADPNYAAVETRIQEEGEGYEIDLVTDGAGHPIVSPLTVAAGDSTGAYHVA